MVIGSADTTLAAVVSVLMALADILGRRSAPSPCSMTPEALVGHHHVEHHHIG